MKYNQKEIVEILVKTGWESEEKNEALILAYELEHYEIFSLQNK